MTSRVDVYGYVCATTSCSGYGQVVATVNGLLQGTYTALNQSIKIRCQTGGYGQRESYAWTWGIAPHDDILQMATLDEAVKQVRKIDKNLDRIAADLDWPRSFAEYATRVLRAANIESVFVNPKFDGPTPLCASGVKGFQRFDAKRCPDELEKAISLLEFAAIARFQPAWRME